MLFHYETANQIKREMQGRDVFVRIIRGKFTGTIAKIVNINTPSFRKVEYVIDIGQAKPVKICGTLLELSEETKINRIFDADHIYEFYDFCGRQIFVGQNVMVSLVGEAGGSDMVLGKVIELHIGHVLVEPIGVNGNFGKSKNRKVTASNHLMILDDQTLKNVMLAKLSS